MVCNILFFSPPRADRELKPENEKLVWLIKKYINDNGGCVDPTVLNPTKYFGTAVNIPAIQKFIISEGEIFGIFIDKKDVPSISAIYKGT